MTSSILPVSIRWGCFTETINYYLLVTSWHDMQPNSDDEAFLCHALRAVCNLSFISRRESILFMSTSGPTEIRHGRFSQGRIVAQTVWLGARKYKEKQKATNRKLFKGNSGIPPKKVGISSTCAIYSKFERNQIENVEILWGDITHLCHKRTSLTNKPQLVGGFNRFEKY